MEWLHTLAKASHPIHSIKPFMNSTVRQPFSPETSHPNPTVATTLATVQKNLQAVGDELGNSRTLVEHSENQSTQAIEQATMMSGSAKEIVGVSALIDEIAEKIKLVSLNASIESAHAGDAGRGFSVVANEVKELAIEAAKANKLIRNKVSNFQSGTNEVIATLETLCTTVARIRTSEAIVYEATEQQVSFLETANTLSQCMLDEFKQTKGKHLERIALAIANNLSVQLEAATNDIRCWTTDETIRATLSLYTDKTRGINTLGRRRWWNPRKGTLDQLIAKLTRQIEDLHRFYQQYQQLMIVSNDGLVLATSDESRAKHTAGQSIEQQVWFHRARYLTKPHSYISEGDFPVNGGASRATITNVSPIHRLSKTHQDRIGFLVAQLDWSQLIENVWRRSLPAPVDNGDLKILILDNSHKVIGTHKADYIDTVFEIDRDEARSGHYPAENSSVIAYAKLTNTQQNPNETKYVAIVA